MFEEIDTFFYPKTKKKNGKWVSKIEIMPKTSLYFSSNNIYLGVQFSIYVIFYKCIVSSDPWWIWTSVQKTPIAQPTKLTMK